MRTTAPSTQFRIRKTGAICMCLTLVEMDMTGTETDCASMTEKRTGLNITPRVGHSYRRLPATLTDLLAPAACCSRKVLCIERRTENWGFEMIKCMLISQIVSLVSTSI